MDFTPYRRAYFALCKSLGMDEAMRHAFNARMTGRESSSAWNAEHWRLVVAELQRLAGQDVQPGRPRIRGRGRCGTAAPGCDSISPGQLEFLLALSAQIAWRTSAEAFIRARLLRPTRKDAWSGKIEDLFRSEAANIITAFKRMASESHAANVAQAPSPVIRPSSSVQHPGGSVLPPDESSI